MLYLLLIPICLGYIQSEKEILSTFYDTLNGDNWKNKKGWKVEDDICKWYGIECDEEGYVLQISLSSNNLIGELPDMRGLSHLYAFTGSNNQLKGNLNVFDGIKSFQAISIKQNLFKGNVIMKGIDMRWFHADYNEFNDITYLIKYNPNIEVIGMTHNKVKTIPRSINSLKKLRTLSLGNNEITSIIPNELLGLEDIATIDLSNNKIPGNIPSDLGKLNKLTEVLLQNNKLIGSIPKSLFNTQSLTLLDLSNNQVSGTLELSKCQSLMSLYLRNTNVEGQIDCLYNSSIRNLDLRGTKYECPIKDCNREVIHADCIDKVNVEVYGMSKCPDFQKFSRNVASMLLDKVGSIINFKTGWIMSKDGSYSTGYSSMHGNNEVIGNFLFQCTHMIYNASYAFEMYNCIAKDVDSVPLHFRECAIEIGIDPEPIMKCAFDDYGKEIIDKSVQMGVDRGVGWCPTVYIGDELYCLYDSFPCKATKDEDFIKAVCDAYKGTNKPSACN